MSPDRNPAARRRVLEIRAGLLHGISGFFRSRGYLFVETPHRIPSPLPESHIDPLPSGGWWLHPSPEICMKRLLADGFGKIVQVARCWRGGERGSLHLPEFTMLEWYRAGWSYRELMEECEDLFLSLAADLGTGGRLRRGSAEIELRKPWVRLSVEEAFGRFGSISMDRALREDRFEEILGIEIEPRLGLQAPAFLYDYPLRYGSLARSCRNDPRFTERFEIYAGGLELANGFSELTDAAEQRRRFELENQNRIRRGHPPWPMPGRFLEALPRMPESAGIALGVDRLVMLFAGAETIDEVVAFPPEDL